jgi:hypothetical protein
MPLNRIESIKTLIAAKLQKNNNGFSAAFKPFD